MRPEEGIISLEARSSVSRGERGSEEPTATQATVTHPGLQPKISSKKLGL